MAEILRFPDEPRAQEQAAAWLARLDRGLTADERRALEEWLDDSDANREALLEYASLWDVLDVLAELSDLFPLERRARVRPRRRIVRGVLAGAAALGAAAVAALVVYGGSFWPAEEAPATRAAASESFATPIGGHVTQQLVDGSLLTLNTDTVLDVELAPASRDLYMRRGEAHFSVARDSARPFRVHVGDRVLEAVGTAFNVYLKPTGSVELTVTEGTVRVAAATAGSADPIAPGDAAGDATNTVVEGEFATLEPGAPGPSRVVRLEPAELDVKLAWQRGMLIFRGEPLVEMLSQVSRYTTTRFEFEGDALRDMRVGGYFRAGDIDGLLLALRENFDIEYERVGADRVVLRTAAR
jgi:transmembrane sensor